jgi:hypothetical protein
MISHDPDATIMPVSIIRRWSSNVLAISWITLKEGSERDSQLDWGNDVASIPPPTTPRGFGGRESPKEGIQRRTIQ